jgi:hypothetical protein
MPLAVIVLPHAPIVVSDMLLAHLGEPQVELTPTGVSVTVSRRASRHFARPSEPATVDWQSCCWLDGLYMLLPSRDA